MWNLKSLWENETVKHVWCKLLMNNKKKLTKNIFEEPSRILELLASGYILHMRESVTGLLNYNEVEVDSEFNWYKTIFLGVISASNYQ